MSGILKDFVENVKLAICEDRKSDGYMRVSGVFQKVDTRNANGRIYSSELWEKVLNDGRTKDLVESRRMLGEVEHPTDSVTNLARVSHIVTKVYRKGNIIIGEAEILNTPSGMIIQELIRRGVPVGISSRGRGTSVQKEGVEYVNPDDFKLDTFDFVYNPSTPGAYPELQESVLAGSPYAKGSPMSAKLDQIKKFDVRAGEIISLAASKQSADDLHKFHKECVEMSGSLSELVESFTDSDNKEHKTYVATVSERIDAATQAVTDSLDKTYSESSLDHRAEIALAGSRSDTQTLSILRDLLAEARKENSYLRTRLDQVTAVVESSEEDILRRYNAATQLCQELMDKLQESLSAQAELSAEHDELTERYKAAVELVADVQERQAAGRLTSLVREAIETHPELAPYVKTLRSCKTEDELRERISELSEAIGLGEKTEAEDLSARVSLSSASKGDEDNESNESVDTSLSRDKKNLTESSDKKKKVPARGTAEKILEGGGSASTPEAELTDYLLESFNLS